MTPETQGQGGAAGAGLAGEGRLVVVSNRLPFTLKRAGDGWRTERSTGGLATAMGPLLKESGGIWVGWSGDASDPADTRRRRLLERWASQDGYFAVDLPADVARGYYEGFSNQALWPLFHHFPILLSFDPEHWRAYREANERFRDEVVKRLRPGDVVWVHDYQLMLLPRLLREAVPDARVGFFLHIPFPSSSVFRLLPRREELLQGLLGADYLAFHTYSYLQNFRSSALRVLGVESRMDTVEHGGRRVRLDALPIGIAPREFTDLLDSDGETRRRLSKLRERYRGRHVLLGVDRLDYTKGIPERLRAFRRLLREAEDLRGRAVLIQVAVPSREAVPMYEELRGEVDSLVGQINGEFSTPDWTPIVYMRRGLARSELAALYAAADLAWVTPLRDGLNLVAKEYVACQRGGAGALVLSEFAGAASEMGEAFHVNPYDEEQMADTVRRALETPEEERRERMAALHARVVRNNVFAWGERFVRNLTESAAARSERHARKPRPLPEGEFVAAYRRARARHLLLDYDGTLVGFSKLPREAVPPPDLPPLLEQLAADPANTVVLISGRTRADLERWFGGVKGLWLAAEHGATVRAPGPAAWEPLRATRDAAWKESVRPVFEHFVDRTPGSLVEEKEFALVWHYRMADPEFGAWLANELVSTLEQLLAETELRAFRGQKIVEVKPSWANKGEALARLAPDPDFCLAAGDDRTDEDLFARLPEDAWTIHVGEHESRARFRLPAPSDLRALLARLAGAGETRTAAAGEQKP
ncbi:MAG TPA: bifunctional alpha,alpha-trehalose-phosphate synthase (UDP-forming)/trehalose-phosphatase [Pyrinomonadaceae bacterium]|nr:bifunctional alpha,alpha-trehalose-phosphate synthase (UDP-forming)/trehalose-phosphatase [Pyrinomonadaceae bacterium]